MRGAKALFQSSPSSFRGSRNRASRSTASVVPIPHQQDTTKAVSVALCAQRTASQTPNIVRHDSESNLHDAEVIITPPPASPPLLLKGDEYCISHDGIARTLYRIEDSFGLSHMSVEEIYDLHGARKKYILRRENGWKQQRSSTVPHYGSDNELSSKTEGVIPLGEPLHLVDIQEIEEGVFAGAGTGATTWDSSIVMPMYFAAYPEVFLGDVVELGSGMGLGGMMAAMGPTFQQYPTADLKSMTLTDYNPQCLERCQQNVQRNYRGSAPIHVSRLDWYDFVRNTNASKAFSQKYDTVIACDCAYLYPDIQALATTMKTLIRPNANSTIHIFGPNNRAGLHELLRQLKEEHSLDLIVSEIDMQRYRLKPSTGYVPLSNSVWKETECPFAAKYDSKFLHVVCSLRQKSTVDDSSKSISEID